MATGGQDGALKVWSRSGMLRTVLAQIGEPCMRHIDPAREEGRQAWWQKGSQRVQSCSNGLRSSVTPGLLWCRLPAAVPGVEP